MQIALDELVSRLADGRTRVLEVLPRASYDDGHLPGARLLPPAEVAAGAAAAIGGPDVPVVVYCSGPTCANSHRAASELRALGYTDVRVFAGGKAAWRAAGRALEVTGGR